MGTASSSTAAAATIPDLSDAGDLSTSSPLTEKLSAEMRIMIYQHLFGAGKYAKLIETQCNSNETDGEEEEEGQKSSGGAESHAADMKLCTSIFAVNKQLHDEALEAFYNNKTIRVTFQQLQRLADTPDAAYFIRDIEITHCLDAIPKEIHLSLKAALRLPRLRSITILSDCISEGIHSSANMTVRGYVTLVNLGEVVCTDIGRYKLQGRFAPVQFAHRKILKMWPNVASTPDDFDVIAEIKEVSRHWEIVSDPAVNLESWASHRYLRIWVALWQHALKFGAKGIALPPLETTNSPRTIISITNWVEGSLMHPEEALEVFAKYKHPTIAIHQLGPEHHSRLLEYVTEELSMNIGAYYRAELINHDFVARLEKPKWAELGEGSWGEEEVQRQDKNQEDYKERWGIINPVNDREWYDIEDMQDMIAMKLPDLVCSRAEDIYMATKWELQPMAFLLVAAGMLEVDWDENNQADLLANWSCRLLQRYFELVLPEYSSETSMASLSTLRRYFSIAAKTIRYVKHGAATQASIEELAEGYRAGLQFKAHQDKSAQGVDGPEDDARAKIKTELSQGEAEERGKGEEGETMYELDGMICESFIEKHAAHLIAAVRIEAMLDERRRVIEAAAGAQEIVRRIEGTESEL